MDVRELLRAWELPFVVYLKTDDIRYLAIIEFYCQQFHWSMRIRTDCSLQPPYIVIDSVEVGQTAYEQANAIAEDINAFMSDFEGTDDPEWGFTDWKRENIDER